MPLESIHKMMCAAQRGRYAVGYFESWNLESLQGVLDAAEQTRSPIIVGFNGEFLSRTGRVARERLGLYAALGKAAAESASVPCGLIFNECSRDEWVSDAIALGFNLVMPADASASLDEYTRRVQTLTTLAHKRGVAVEAELGELPLGVPPSGGTCTSQIPTKVGTPNGALTDPSMAAEFVHATRVDLLAVSVGNVHIKLNGEQPLDLERLTAIRNRLKIPLVLHGGTGIEADSLRAAIALGVTKVNYGTYLKQRYRQAVRDALKSHEKNPHVLFGMGGPEDVMVAGRLAVRDAVLERIESLGCCGKS